MIVLEGARWQYLWRDCEQPLAGIGWAVTHTAGSKRMRTEGFTDSGMSSDFQTQL